MILGIEASNIRHGGGLNHLVEVLAAVDPGAHGFSRVVVWSGTATLRDIAERPWLVKQHHPWLDKSAVHRAVWQRRHFSAQARAAGCDVVFVPGGSFAGDFRPMVTFSQNLLPFDWPEIRRFGLSGMTLKFIALRLTQGHTFRRADGLIFLTQYARDRVMKTLGHVAGTITTIPYGINARFRAAPRPQRPILECSDERPFRLLYVSPIHMYKHQWRVAEAVAQLRSDGLPVTLDCIGPAYPPALQRLTGTLDRLDPDRRFLRYAGVVPYAEMAARYADADLCVFASSCETFGQIVTEAMSAGLPIACSDRSAMPELLGDAAVYFDPERPSDIARAVRTLIEDPALRAEKARASFARAQAFSWTQCATETFAFLAGVAGRAQTR